MKTSWFKTMAAACAVSLASLGAFGAESITLTTSNHYPWDGKVDCQTTLSGLTSGETYYGVFSLTVDSTTKVVTNENLKADGTYTTTIDCTDLFGTSVCTTGAGITVKLYKQKPLGGVQLWEGGPYFAETNIGAENPQDSGYYFWWGDTVGCKRKNNIWVMVNDETTEFLFSGSNVPTNNKSLDELKTLGYIDSTTDPCLNAAHDAATQYLGAPWRIMTDAELTKLVDTSYCTRTWTTKSGVSGWEVKGAQKGYTDKSIFLPLTGCGYSNMFTGTTMGYGWSSTPTGLFAYYLKYSSGSFEKPSIYRYYGYPIRPVRSGSAVAGNDTEAASASGTFDVDTRAIKTTTLAGVEIVGGETSITLNYSPNAWGEYSAGTSVSVAYTAPGSSTPVAIVLGQTTAGSVDWTPPAEAGTYTVMHQANGSFGGNTKTTYFTVVVYTAEVQPKPALNTSVEGVYTNGVPVEKTGGKYIVKKGANVTVKFQGGSGYFFQDGESYVSTWSENATATSDPTEVTCSKTPVQGTSCGGGVYGFLDSGAMTMVGSGAATSMPFGKYSITSVKIGDGVTSLGANFFKGCANIVTVTGGKDLTSVGSEAFYLCMSLETIALDCSKPDGMDAAVKFLQAYVQGQGWKSIPDISYKGSVIMLYGKNDLKDEEWTKIGPAKNYKTMEETGFHFFQTRVEDEEVAE